MSEPDKLPDQEGDAGGLVAKPRYQGQSAGMPHGTTGPEEESRYGAAPLSTGQGEVVTDKLKEAVSFGTPNSNTNHLNDHLNEERGLGQRDN